MFPRGTSPQVFDLAKTELGESKDAVVIRWNYPMDTLTLIIETGYTRDGQSYAIAFESMGDDVTHVYQDFNGEDIEIKADSGKFILESDSNGQVIAKLQSWPEMTVYLAIIKYEIIQK